MRDVTLIVDSGPLIALSLVDRVDLLHALYREVWVPMAVVKEVSGQGSFRIGSDVFARHEWIQQVPVATPSSPVLAACLGRGEVEVIQLGFSRKDVLLLIDDYRARRAAEAWGLLATGSAGVLTCAKEHGLIDAVLPLLNAMRSAGYHISDAVIEAARLRAHE